MPTRKEIDDLKANWAGDPCWDIETTDGFEEYHAELMAFRIKMEAQWDREWQEELRKYAHEIGLENNLKLAEYIRGLWERIEKLETLDKLRIP